LEQGESMAAILPMIFIFFRRMWVVKQLLEKNHSEKNILDLLGGSSYAYRDIFATHSNFSYQHIQLIFEKILDAELQLKTTQKSPKTQGQSVLDRAQQGNQPTDEELIARFQNGDAYAFDLLVHRYKDPLLNFIYRFLSDLVESEDIVQETFYRVYKNKHYYKEVAKFSTWIYTIAGNLAKTELRRRKRRKVFSIHKETAAEKELELPDLKSDPEKEVNTIVTEKIIQKAITSLPQKFRQVIVLRDIQGFSYEEISSIIKVPLGTVKSRVNRARLKLQEDLSFLLEDLESVSS
jgi:RNA polymerase sigma-70 factor (ECF subfamily)